MRPHFRIINNSGQNISLDTLTIRYWYTADTVFEYQELQCWYADIGCVNIVTQPESVVFYPTNRVDADYYFQVAFTGNRILYNGGETGGIQLGVHKDDFSLYDMNNDYSFGDMETWTEAEDVTLYMNGVTVWGQEPAPL
jgi:hypothetical protein